MKRRGVYLALFTDSEGDSCFGIYQKITFCKLKTSLSRKFTIYKHFGDFVKRIFTILLQIKHENNFLPTSKHRQALGICLYDCFIYSSNFVFRKCSEATRHLGFGRKTVNSQGYSELREPIKTREKCY